MTYPKSIMTRPELMKMGFTKLYLTRAFHSERNNFATRMNPSKKKSTIIFDTEKFEAWRQNEIKAQRGRS